MQLELFMMSLMPQEKSLIQRSTVWTIRLHWPIRKLKIWQSSKMNFWRLLSNSSLPKINLLVSNKLITQQEMLLHKQMNSRPIRVRVNKLFTKRPRPRERLPKRPLLQEKLKKKDWRIFKKKWKPPLESKLKKKRDRDLQKSKRLRLENKKKPLSKQDLIL